MDCTRAPAQTFEANTFGLLGFCDRLGRKIQIRHQVLTLVPTHDENKLRISIAFSLCVIKRKLMMRMRPWNSEVHKFTTAQKWHYVLCMPDDVTLQLLEHLRTLVCGLYALLAKCNVRQYTITSVCRLFLVCRLRQRSTRAPQKEVFGLTKNRWETHRVRSNCVMRFRDVYLLFVPSFSDLSRFILSQAILKRWDKKSQSSYTLAFQNKTCQWQVQKNAQLARLGTSKSQLAQLGMTKSQLAQLGTSNQNLHKLKNLHNLANEVGISILMFYGTPHVQSQNICLSASIHIKCVSHWEKSDDFTFTKFAKFGLPSSKTP